MVDSALRPFSRDPSLAAWRVHRDLALLVVAVAAFAVPFLAQPFHMDDNFYLDMARNALSSPLFPNDTPYVFHGTVLPDMGSHSHPPLHTYFLALVLRFAGEGAGREWVFHLCALIYPVAAAIAFYFIAAIFVERPLWPALVLAAAPLFMVMQHTLMTDVPTLAWWLAAIALFLHGTDRGSVALLAASSLCQFGAMFTSYQSVALSPLLAFYQLRRRGRASGWIALAAPLCAMAGWFALNYSHYGRFLLTDTAGYIASRSPHSAGSLWIKLVAILQYQGWLIVFPIFLIYLSGRVLRGRFLALLIVVSVYLTQVTVPDYRAVDKGIFAVGLVAGLAVLTHFAAFTTIAFRDPERSGFGNVEGQFLALWYTGVLAYCLLLFTEGSARYILPLVPPVLMGLFRHLELAEAAEYRFRPKPLLSAAMIASGSLVVSLGWGLLLSHADQEFARIYPRAAVEFARITGGMRSFYAGEWGFRYYFRRAGAQQLPVDESQVPGGSWLARPRLALPYDVPAALWTMGVPVQTLGYDVRTPLRVLDWHSPAGFYSTSWGLIPFSVSRDSLELVDVRQVNYLVERLPWARVESTSNAAWPGFVEIQGSSPLALLAHPDCTVSYPWEAGQDLVLDLKLGLGPGSWSEGEDNPVTFRVLQRAPGGEIMGQEETVLNPGRSKEHRRWQACRLLLQNRIASLLELEIRAPNRKTGVTAAFAHPVLSPAP